jgi:ferric-dicitrate binding protein FerR (iron transport regulator)
MIYNAKSELIANRGQQNEYNLPDGSLVSMNAESKISYNQKDFLEKRKVSFEGEAFFNIKKGNKFCISTNNAEIQILGTSFNVYARDTSFKVSCFTGKIKVISGDQSVIIIPGESAIFEDKILRKFSEKNINIVANWRNGEFYFENASLTLVFKEIERQFNVTFVMPNVDKKYFTGSFSNKNLIDALDIACIPMGLTYEIGINSKVFIHEKLR